MGHYFGVSCVGCLSTAHALDRARRKRHHFIGDRFALGSAQLASKYGVSRVEVLVTFDVTAVVVVDRSGKPIDDGHALSKFRELLALGWKDGGWRVQGFTVQR
jgi:hypothetical protein